MSDSGSFLNFFTCFKPVKTTINEVCKQKADTVKVDPLVFMQQAVLAINKIDAGYLLTFKNVNKLCLFFSVKVNKI